MMCILPYRTLENVISGVVITFVDITEMKLAEEALRKANEQHRLAVIVLDAHDAITLQDLEGRILAWNPAAEQMYGWSEAEALAMNIKDMIPASLRIDYINDIQKLVNSKIISPYTTQRVAKDGQIVQVQLTTTALLDKAGKTYAIATTERKLGKK
jgi:two-component system CheB/CheR fusion protein